MSDNKKWVDLGDITPQFRLEGKKLQIQYPNKEWEDLADFSDVALSLDLRLNDETNAVEIMQSNGEWAVLLDLSKVGGGIKTVQTYRDLPADAKEGDVCLVLEDGYSEDEWQPLTIEDIGYERVSQIRFRDTIEESLSATGFDFDSHISIPPVIEEPLLSFYCKNGKIFYLFLGYTKTDGISSTSIMVTDDEEDVYILCDNTDSLNGVLTLPDGLVAGKWNHITESSLTILDTAPAFDVVSFYSYAIEISETLNGESKRIYENMYPAFSYEKLFLPLIEANVSTKQNKGLYTYDGEKWRYIESKDVVLYEEIFEDEGGKKSDLVDFLRRQSLFDKTVSVYVHPRKSIEAESSIMNSWGNLNSLFYTNGTDRSSSSITYWLNENVSDETLEAFSGKTIVFTDEEKVARATISCTNGMILVCRVDSAVYFAVYNSQAGAEFNPEIFKDVCSDYERMPTAILNETGWYICFNGLLVKAETRFTVKNVVGGVYEKEAPGLNYLVDGITSEIPDVEGEGDTITFNDLFMYAKQAFGRYLSNGEIVSYVYEVPYKFNVYFDTPDDFRILRSNQRLDEIDNSHRHNNLYQLNKAAETWHEHKNFEYIESLVDTNVYSKVNIAYGNLIISDENTPLSNLDNYYDAEGASPKAFQNMLTVGTPYPFWSLVRGKVFYDWGLYAPHITEFGDVENPIEFINTYMKGNAGTDELKLLKRQLLQLVKKHASEITDVSYFFERMDIILAPEFNTSNVATARETFYNTPIRCINNWDLSSLENATGMCIHCDNLQYFNPTSDYDCYVCLPVIKNMSMMFGNCNSIKSMCIDFGGNSVSSSVMSDAFYVMKALTDLNFVNGSIKVDGDFSPFGTETTTSTNSKTGVTTTTNVFTSVLTADSIVNFLNYLEDNTGGTQYTVTVPKTPYDLLTDEQKAIATNKNIILKGE